MKPQEQADRFKDLLRSNGFHSEVYVIHDSISIDIHIDDRKRLVDILKEFISTNRT